MLRVPCTCLSSFTLAVCSATLSAQTTWSRFDERTSTAMAPRGTSVVLFGGVDPQSNRLLGDTQEYSNGGWIDTPTVNQPVARSGHAMAGSVGGAATVLFGGITQTGVVATTWTFNGNNWSQIVAAVEPSPRQGHAMAQTTNASFWGGRAILVGGFDGSSRNDVWEWDHVTSQWAHATPAGTAPSPRQGHAMAFDPNGDAPNGQVLVYGGSGFQTDTWALRSTGWVQLGSGPTARKNSAMAYHPNSGKIVLFGGEDVLGVRLGDTWTFNNGVWTPEPMLGTPPPARSGHAMSVDPQTLDVIVLGGSSANGQPITGTYRWNGGSWLPMFLTTERTGAAMVYRQADRKHLMFGGRNAISSADLGDTWELSGSTWAPRSPVTSPSARADAALVHDPVRNRTVLYGGRTGGNCGTELGDTWEWNGSNWVARNPTLSPGVAGGVQGVWDSARSLVWLLRGQDMWSYGGNSWAASTSLLSRTAEGTVDTLRGRVVMFGGRGAGGLLDETWEWDGAAWQRANPVVRPSAREHHAMQFDPIRQEVLLVGGTTGSNETWAWNGQTWTQRASLSSSRYGAASSFDSVRGRVVLLGGDGSGNFNQTVYEWNGSAWNSPGASLPLHHFGAAACFDVARGVTVVFGGSSGSTGTPVGTTWEWNGTAMVVRTPATSPSARRQPSMAYDPVAQRVLLFGGTDASGNQLADLWSWDGTNWTQIGVGAVNSPTSRENAVVVPALSGGGILVFGGASGPSLSTLLGDMRQWDGSQWETQYVPPLPSRTNYGAAYDPVRDRTVVFGGRTACNPGSYFQDTWEWDGDQWIERTPTSRPSPRARAKLAFDASRNRVVLFGGTNGTTTFADTWEWDGTDWIQRVPDRSPPASNNHALSYDPEHQLTVALTGDGTWNYQPVHQASLLPYGTPCTSAIGTPELEFAASAGPWIGTTFTVDAAPVPAGTLGFLVVGLGQNVPPQSLGAIGLPQCELRANPLTYALMLTAGPASVQGSLGMPTSPVFAGFPLHVQGLLLAPAGWGVTQPVRCVLGDR